MDCDDKKNVKLIKQEPDDKKNVKIIKTEPEDKKVDVTRVKKNVVRRKRKYRRRKTTRRKTSTNSTGKTTKSKKRKTTKKKSKKVQPKVLPSTRERIVAKLGIERKKVLGPHSLPVIRKPSMSTLPDSRSAAGLSSLSVFGQGLSSYNSVPPTEEETEEITLTEEENKKASIVKNESGSDLLGSILADQTTLLSSSSGISGEKITSPTTADTSVALSPKRENTLDLVTHDTLPKEPIEVIKIKEEVEEIQEIDNNNEKTMIKEELPEEKTNTDVTRKIKEEDVAQKVKEEDVTQKIKEEDVTQKIKEEEEPGEITDSSIKLKRCKHGKLKVKPKDKKRDDSSEEGFLVEKTHESLSESKIEDLNGSSWKKPSKSRSHRDKNPEIVSEVKTEKLEPKEIKRESKSEKDRSREKRRERSPDRKSSYKSSSDKKRSSGNDDHSKRSRASPNGRSSRRSRSPINKHRHHYREKEDDHYKSSRHESSSRSQRSSRSNREVCSDGKKLLVTVTDDRNKMINTRQSSNSSSSKNKQTHGDDYKRSKLDPLSDKHKLAMTGPRTPPTAESSIAYEPYSPDDQSIPTPTLDEADPHAKTNIRSLSSSPQNPDPSNVAVHPTQSEVTATLAHLIQLLPKYAQNQDVPWKDSAPAGSLLSQIQQTISRSSVSKKPAEASQNKASNGKEAINKTTIEKVESPYSPASSYSPIDDLDDDFGDGEVKEGATKRTEASSTLQAAIDSFLSRSKADEVPGSAVDLKIKDKYIKKLNRQERVVEEVKVVLKPIYQRREITKDEYKEIMRKAVPKVVKNKTGEINPRKIQSLVEGYVKKFRHLRKKSKGGSKSSRNGVGDLIIAGNP